jgi:hypothetical protein
MSSEVERATQLVVPFVLEDLDVKPRHDTVTERPPGETPKPVSGGERQGH